MKADVARLERNIDILFVPSGYLPPDRKHQAAWLLATQAESLCS